MTLFTGFDRKFVILTSLLIIIGFIFFLSGAFFLFSNKSELFWSTLYRHVGFGLLGGIIVGYIVSLIPVSWYIRYAPYIAAATVGVALLVFVPGLAVTHGGATRWIDIGGFSFQPAEFMKIGVILFGAWWFGRHRQKIHELRYGLLPFLSILGVTGAIMLLQPDTDGFVVIGGSLMLMYIFAGAPWRHILGCVMIGVMLAGGLVMTKPYLRDRLQTFINPAVDPLGSSYHVHQSLIAIGSGGMWGRGYGKGIHKYQYLPEPMGDTIFAVIGEEMGFIGTSFVVVLFFFWYMRAVVLSVHVASFFSRFVIFGLANVILIQAFLNILSNLGLFPFSGLPLPFMSQGGTALFVAVISVSIILKCSENYNAKKVSK